MSERLHKVLAQHGIGSRREVERWIAEGRLQINGVIAKTGDRYVAGDSVQLDGREVGKRLGHSVSAQVLAYHKPQGQPIERPAANQTDQPAEDIAESVMERLPVQRGSRWVAINPMHPGDSGLLLFTNDGALSYALTRQKKQIPTTYMVRVHVRGGIASAPTLPTTLQLDDGKVEFDEVSVSSSAPEGGESETGNIWYKVVMPRADKRAAVRALFVSHGLTVSRMMQVAFADIELTKEMPRARHLSLKPTQLASLYALAKLPVPVQEGARPARTKRVADGEYDERDEAAPNTKTGARGKRPTYTAEQARAATRARPAAAGVEAASNPRAPQQRAELRRRAGGGSNRPSRPGASRPSSPRSGPSRSGPRKPSR
ncbi:MAG: S4 domain-containing protein [Steroidobacteraceae bacterium]